MLTVHHLAHSRSTRVLWLLEELGQPYEMVRHERDPRTLRAGASLAGVHALARAPVIEDGGRVIAESGAIIEYLVATYGGGRLGPAPGTRDWPAYIEWLHFAEGTAMAAVMMKLVGGDTLGRRGRDYVEQTIGAALDQVERALDGRDFLVGPDLTGADIQLHYVLEFAFDMGLADRRPTLVRYLDRLTGRDAYRRAIDKGGPTRLPRP